VKQLVDDLGSLTAAGRRIRGITGEKKDCAGGGEGEKIGKWWDRRGSNNLPPHSNRGKLGILGKRVQVPRRRQD